MTPFSDNQYAICRSAGDRRCETVSPFLTHYLTVPATLSTISLKSKLAELNDIVADPTLYDDTSKANRIVTERSKVEAKLLTVERLTSELEQWREMHGEKRHHQTPRTLRCKCTKCTS